MASFNEEEKRPMTLVLVKPKPRIRVPAVTMKSGVAAVAPAGARLLEYFGLGAQVAVTTAGMMLATQADHLLETVRIGDIRE